MMTTPGAAANEDSDQDPTRTRRRVPRCRRGWAEIGSVVVRSAASDGGDVQGTDVPAAHRPAADVPGTWVVVPLYNESAVIAQVVAGLREHFRDVVCVDDGSTDGSAALAARAGAVVVRHPLNLGQGAALQTGICHALRDPDLRYVVTFDADGQHQVADAVAMVERLAAGEAQVVFGSRFLDTRTRPGPFKRMVLRTAVAYTNVVTGLRLTDAHNGLRAFDADVARALDLRQNRMAHASEIVAQVGRGRFRWVEHPVHILYTEYSRSKGQSILNSVNILVDLMIR